MVGPMPDARATVWWDFDGTLAYRDGMWSAALISALGRVHPTHGVAVEQIKPGLRDGFPWHRPETLHSELADADTWWAALHPLFVAAYRAADVAADVAGHAAALVREVYADVSGWRLLEGAGEALELTFARGIRNVVVSNHVPELPALITGLGLSDLVADVVNSASVGAEKPNPVIFAAARAVSIVDRPIWMVGDSELADIGGAAAVGVPGILVGKTSGRTALDAARAIVADVAA